MGPQALGAQDSIEIAVKIRDDAQAVTGAEALQDGTQHDFHSGMAPVHPTWRLPPEIVHGSTGHYGSHLFLVDDFVRSCTSGALPPNHVWAAARYNLPGIIAHESALREGELSKLFPIIALTYVWVTLLSYWLLNDSPNLYKNAGIAIIVIGVAILGQGGERK